MYWRFVLALVLVLALIFAVAWIAKRLGLGGRMATARGKRRLSIEEVLSLDAKRRLVLVKRDGIEHLVLLGIGSDVVIETGITASPDTPPQAFGALLPGAPR
jgi:flagellar protein FliO/FliZ